MIQTQSSTLVDPFQGLSIISLNPRTFGDIKDPLKSEDLEAIHQHMNSMALRNPDKHFEKARSIVDGSSEFLNTKESEANTKDKGNRQEHRPALARKRAKFSLKSDTSQPSPTAEPSFQIDQLQGPEEFFAAYEKFENARKEIKRQRGGEDLNEAKISTTVRHRRPEIPRRKVSYKHHEYSSQSTSFAQETLQDNIESPPTQQQESVTANCESKEDEVTGSIAKTEDRINKLFDELMSSNIGGLDGNEALSLLKDRLQIKPVDTSNLRLPDFHDIHRIDFISPVKNLIKDQSVLSDTCVSSDGLKGQTLGKQKKLSDNPFHPLASPTPPKSPFLAISTFGQHLSKSIESNDPFSSRDIDSPPTTASTEIIGRLPAHVSKNKELSVSGTLNSLAENKVTETAVRDVTQEASAVDSISSPETDKLLNDNMYGRSATSLSESLSGVEDREQCHNMDERDVDDKAEDMVQKEASVAKPSSNVEDITDNVHPECEQDIEVEDMVQKEASVAKPSSNVEDITDNVHPECEQDIEENVEDIIHKAGSSTLPEVNVEDITNNVHPQCVQDIGENVEDVIDKAGSSTSPEVNVEVSTIEDLKSHPSQSGANSIEGLDANRPTQNPASVPEQQNEEHLRPSTNKRKNKMRTRQVDQRKRRQSLAEAGTSWKSGVRRSNRVRRKPLEYWKGERLLYGRVHNSLPTVIGVKYISLTEDNGKPGFKVESFVSDKYKDLVELTALH